MTKNKALWLFSVAVALFLVSGPLLAHHSEAALDKDSATTVTGTVTKWMFSNPHPTVYLDGDVKDAQGKTVNWFAAGGGREASIPASARATPGCSRSGGFSIWRLLQRSVISDPAGSTGRWAGA